MSVSTNDEDLDPDWSVTLYAETLQFPRPPASPSWSVSEADTSLPATPSSPTFPLQPFQPLRITKRALSPGALSRSTASSFSTVRGAEDEDEHRRLALHHATLNSPCSTTSLVRSRSSSYNPPQSQVDARRLVACGRPSTADAGIPSTPFISPRIQPLRLAKRASPPSVFAQQQERDALPMHAAELITLTHAPPPPRSSSLPPGVSDAPGRAAAFQSMSTRITSIHAESEVSLAATSPKECAAPSSRSRVGSVQTVSSTLSSSAHLLSPPLVHHTSSCEEFRRPTADLVYSGQLRASPRLAQTPESSKTGEVPSPSYRIPSTPPRSPTTARSLAVAAADTPAPNLSPSADSPPPDATRSIPPHPLRRRPRIMIPNAWTQRAPPSPPPPTPPPSAVDSGLAAHEDKDTPQLSPLVAPPLELSPDDDAERCVPKHSASPSRTYNVPASPSADSSADWTLLTPSPASSPARHSPPRRPLPPPPPPPKPEPSETQSKPAPALTPVLAPLRSRWSASTLSLAQSVSVSPTPAVETTNSKPFTSLRRYMYFTGAAPSAKGKDCASVSASTKNKIKYKPLPFSRTLNLKGSKRTKPLTVADVRVIGGVAAGW